MTFSSLPKLKKNFTQVEQFLASENITPLQLSHEIQRLFPRIKKLKSQIDDLGNEIPQNTTSLFDDMKKDIEILTKPNSQITEQDLILKEFSKMKSRILLKLEKTKQESNQNLEKKLKSILNSTKNIENDDYQNIFDLLDLDNKNSSSSNNKTKTMSANELNKQFQAELDNIDLRLDSQMSRTTNRLLEFEKILSNKSITMNDNKSIRSLEEALSEASNVKNEIIQYNSKISTLENIMKQLNLNFNDKQQNMNDFETSNPLDGLPDLGFKLTDVKNEIQKSQDEQTAALDELEDTISKCENRITEQEKEVKSLLETAQTLLSSTTESERNANSLFDLVNDTALSFSSNPTKHAIQALYAEYQSKQTAIRNELTALNERLKQASFDVPLFKRFQV